MGGTLPAANDEEPPDTAEPVWVILAVDIVEPGTVVVEDILQATVTVVSGELCNDDGW